MNRSFPLLVISVLLGMPLAVIAGGKGSITGTVEASPSRFGKNTVVYIKKIDGEVAAPSEPVVMDQKDLAFDPKVLPVVEGTTVEFLNSDDVLHNVFTPDKCAERFNLGSWPKGEVRSYTFDESGCSPVVLCNVHPEMEAFIVVLQNPYYAVTSEDGGFTIEDVPAGTHTLEVWNERLHAETMEVTVTEGNEANVIITLKR